jgi:hypothetical protein
MSSSRESSQELLRKNLSAEIQILQSLQPHDTDMRQYILESIFKAISIDNRIFNLNLNSSVIQQLIQIAIDIVDERVRPFMGEAWWSCKIWAVRMMILIIKNMSCNQEELVYNSLVKNVLLDTNPHHREELVGLSAYCLSLTRIEHYLTPGQAHKLIVDVLPLVMTTFDRESRRPDPRSRFTEFESKMFHCLEGPPAIEDTVVPYSYPMWIRLLVSLVTSDSGSHYRFFEGIISEARRENGLVDTKVFVALNVLLVGKFLSSRSIGDFDDSVEAPISLAGDFNDYSREFHDIMKNLLDRSDGNIGSHIAFLLLKFHQLHILNSCDNQDALCTAACLLDSLIKDGNILHVDVFIEFIHHYHDSYEDTSLNPIFEGKQVDLMSKLTQLDVAPRIYNVLADLMPSVPESQKYTYDNLIQKPLANVTDHLRELTRYKNRTYHEDNLIADLVDTMLVLLKQRSHRPKVAIELSIIEIYKNLICDEKLNQIYLKSRYSKVIIQANQYQVHPTTWDLILHMLHKAESGAVRSPAYSAINEVVPKILVWDSEHFFYNVATPDLLFTTLKYCEKAIRSQLEMAVLVSEILLTWPQDISMTRLGYSQYLDLLKKFIQLVYLGLEMRCWYDPNRITSEHMREIEAEKEEDLLFALAVAYARHRRALLEVLSTFERTSSLIDCKSWLRDNLLIWYKIVSTDRTQEATDFLRRGLLINLDRKLRRNFEFTRVVIAHLGLRAIKEELTRASNDFHEVAPSIQTTLMTTLNSLRLSHGLSSNAIEKRVLQKTIDTAMQDFPHPPTQIINR